MGLTKGLPPSPPLCPSLARAGSISHSRGTRPLLTIRARMCMWVVTSLCGDTSARTGARGSLREEGNAKSSCIISLFLTSNQQRESLVKFEL